MKQGSDTSTKFASSGKSVKAKSLDAIRSYGSNANVQTSRLNAGGDMKFRGKRG